MNPILGADNFFTGESCGKRIFPNKYKRMATAITIHIPIKTSLFNNPHCLTRSAFDRNFIAIAISRKPNTTFTEFSHPPDFGKDCSQFGKIANTVKGSANAKPKPASPAVNGHEPCAAVPASNEPSIGPVSYTHLTLPTSDLV